MAYRIEPGRNRHGSWCTLHLNPVRHFGCKVRGFLQNFGPDRDRSRNQDSQQDHIDDCQGHLSRNHLGRVASDKVHDGRQQMGQQQGEDEQDQRLANYVHNAEGQENEKDAPSRPRRTPIQAKHDYKDTGPTGIRQGMAGILREAAAGTCILGFVNAAEQMRSLVENLEQLEDDLRVGGGPQKIEKQHRAGKLTARERIAYLADRDAMFLEIGLLIAHDQYDGQAPAAGVVTGVARIEGRPAVIVANDATVKAGAWWPETIHKILRAQEIAMRNRIPIVYLVDSAGVNLPYQDGIFPSQYGAARIFYYNSLMRRKLRVPQIAAVMGMCIAGGAYLPALSDVIILGEGTSFMGLGGPNLVKGAVGQVVDAESLGGASLHTRISGVAHYAAKDDLDCLRIIRDKFRELPAHEAAPKGTAP